MTLQCEPPACSAQWGSLTHYVHLVNVQDVKIATSNYQEPYSQMNSGKFLDFYITFSFFNKMAGSGFNKCFYCAIVAHADRN